MASSQVLDDRWDSPEAVPTGIDGVSSLTFTVGACLVMYNPEILIYYTPFSTRTGVEKLTSQSGMKAK